MTRNSKNLKPFKKNDPRINKGGRPKWKHLTEMLKNETKQDAKYFNAASCACVQMHKYTHPM